MPERDRDIEGCHSKAAEIITSQNDIQYYTVAMCSFHYRDFMSEEGLDKPFNMKDNAKGNESNTGTFYKISDLPVEWRRNKEDKPYPIKQANQIVRIKTADGKEWLKSKQQWIAIDGQGNEIMQSFPDLEVWDKPDFELILNMV